MLSTRYEDAIPLLHDFLFNSARQRPDSIALVTDEGRFTYEDIQRASTALAWTFVLGGVEPGDRVIVLADNDVRTCIAFWAALSANAVPCLVSPQTREKKLAYLLDDCRPTALVSPGRLVRTFGGPARASSHLRITVVSGEISSEALSELPCGITWDEACGRIVPKAEPPPRRAIDVDLASIIYTSGSTGEPKGVMHTHRSMRAAASSVGAYLENRPDDVILNVLPMSFDYGLYQMIMAFAVGARLVLERSFALPIHVLKRASEEGVTAFPGVPTMFAMIDDLASELDLSRVRYVTNTAAPLMRKHVRTLKRTFPRARIYSMYGLTECKRVSFLPPEDLERKPGSVGVAIPNTEVWVVDAKGERVPPGEIGQVVVRGSTVMAGYWEKPEATSERLGRGPIPGERVLLTGDWATVDDEGYLYFLGRSDDVIKSRGEKVAPREVEDALLDIPGIREAAVVGVPDQVSGQAPKAYVVLEPGVGLTPREVILECKKRLESHMVPKEVVVRPDLPKTSTGKIRKAGLDVIEAIATEPEESNDAAGRSDPRLRDGGLLRTRGSEAR